MVGVRFTSVLESFDDQDHERCNNKLRRHGATYATVFACIRLPSRLNDYAYHLTVKIGPNSFSSVLLAFGLQMLSQVICMNKSTITFKALIVTVSHYEFFHELSMLSATQMGKLKSISRFSKFIIQLIFY